MSGCPRRWPIEWLAALPQSCRSALVEVALRGRCTWADVGDPDALAPALAEEVIRDDGRSLGFAHPLFARATLDSANPAELAPAHEHAAQHCSDPLDRARHLAARVYRKLGVRNRTELAARWSELG